MLGFLLLLAIMLGSPDASATPAGHPSPLGPAPGGRVPPPVGAGKESRPPAPSSTKAAAATVDPSLTEEAVTDARIEVIAPGRINAGEGSLYFVTLERSQGLPADEDTGSECVLYENGRALGPARASVEQIQASGRGAYSHVRFATLAFSSSDNSSPITNGRTYALDCTRRIVASRSRVVTTAPSISFDLPSSAGAVWNRRATIRNLDPVTAVRTRIRARGMPDLSSTAGILASILAPGMTPEDKSIAIWRLLTNLGYNWHPAQADAEVHDPVKFMNVYGYGYCDDFAESFAALAGAAGIPSQIHYLGGHIVAESFYDGQWHMFDPDFGLYFRGADGRILGVEELAADPTPLPWYLVDIYTTTADNLVGQPSGSTQHRIEPVLQPGDELVFDSGPASLVRNVYLADKGNPPLAGTGTLTRTLAFAGAPAEVVVPFEWPYVLVGGSFSGDGEVAISANGVDWTTTRAFASWFAGRSEASYRFYLRVRNPGPGGILSVAFQFAPLSLPAVQPGVTTFDLDIVPVSGTLGADWRGVEIVQEWEDRTAPGTYAIATGVTPAAGGIARCSPDPVAAGGTVSCTATPNPGFAFTGWSGDCTGASCRLANVTSVKSVAAAFGPVRYAITATVSPAGGGTVSCSPNPVDFGGTSTCTATANTGFSFAGWSGDCTGTACTLGNVTGARSVSATFEPLPSGISRLVNLSTRVKVLTGNDALIGGFVIAGTATKTVVIRARGPSLAALGVTGTLADPVLQLFSGQTPVAYNDNWRDGADAATLEAYGFAPSDPREAAIYATLGPGAYTAIVRGVNDGTGVGIFEVFEVDRAESLLVNISTRGPVFSGTNPMIAGFIIQGSEPRTVVVRARGPSLADAGVAGYLVNPLLIVYSGSRAIAVNDDWQTLAEAPQLVASGFAPSLPLEAAVILTLPPGAYTAVVNGTGTSSGIAIVEVFGL